MIEFNNPESNVLPLNITLEKLDETIKTSGYPLQQSVSSYLREQGFSVHPEWAYEDPSEQKLRNIDMHAGKRYRHNHGDKLRIRPRISLLIECKKSIEPYIFFQESAAPVTPEFPLITGLRHQEIAISTNGTSSRFILTPGNITVSKKGLISDPPVAQNFTKVEYTKKQRLTLSGAEPFNSLVIPTLNAMQAYAKIQKPTPSTAYFDMDIVLGLAILDAPMMLVEVKDNIHTTRPAPWIRVMRHSPDVMSKELFYNRSLFGIEVVHKDFLSEFIEKHIDPFADTWAARVIQMQDVLLNGSGYLEGLSERFPEDLSKSKFTLYK